MFFNIGVYFIFMKRAIMKTDNKILYYILAIILLSTNIVKSQNVFVTRQQLLNVKDCIEKKQQPTLDAFLQLEQDVKENQNYSPSVLKDWYVPGYYVDADGHVNAKKSLQDGANNAYGFALYYRLTNNKEYAALAINIINAWATEVKSFSHKDDSKLSFSYHFPALILAADLVRNSELWLESDQRIFEKFLKEKAIPMNTMSSKNNWGNWGLVLASAGAAYLQDSTLLQQCAERWKYFIEHQVAEDGHLPHEVTRNEGKSGIWYSHFSLFPQTIAAEILKNNGHNLYGYISPNNRSLKDAFYKIACWSRYPEKFPYWQGDPKKLGGVSYFSYFEILVNHWPDKNAAELIKQSRPLTARHSAPFITLTHGTR